MRFILVVVTTTIFFLVSLPLYAIPLVYTFAGNIESISENDVFKSTTSIDGINFSVSDPIEYQFIIDFQRQGFCNFPTALPTDDCNGSDIDDDYVNGVLTRDYFYVEFLAANKDSPLNYLDIDYNLGIDHVTAGFGQAFASSAILLQTNSLVRQWQEKTDLQPGTSVIGLDYWDNGLFGVDNIYGNITSNMILVDISPIPTPQTIVLFLLGGVMMLWQRKLTSLKNQIPNTMA